jgi:hypothetical protein
MTSQQWLVQGKVKNGFECQKNILIAEQQQQQQRERNVMLT